LAGSQVKLVRVFKGSEVASGYVPSLATNQHSQLEGIKECSSWGTVLHHWQRTKP
jgi:hypothetical protein